MTRPVAYIAAKFQSSVKKTDRGSLSGGIQKSQFPANNSPFLENVAK